MSKYTTELRYICEMYSGLNKSKGYSDMEQIISDSRSKIFDFNYPIFDEEYKSVLETKIIKHFYFNEIGEETVGLWKARLNMRLNEIMPYYNELYVLEKRKLENNFNPLFTTNIITEHTGNGSDITESNNVITEEQRKEESANGTTESNSSSSEKENAESWEYYSDTPQGTIGNLEDLSYLTNATNNNNISNSSDSSSTDSTTETTSNETTDRNKIDKKDETKETTENYLRKTYGYQNKSMGKLIEEYRNSIINIDTRIIKDLDNLFMMIW